MSSANRSKMLRRECGGAISQWTSTPGTTSDTQPPQRFLVGVQRAPNVWARVATVCANPAHLLLPTPASPTSSTLHKWSWLSGSMAATHRTAHGLRATCLPAPGLACVVQCCELWPVSAVSRGTRRGRDSVRRAKPDYTRRTSACSTVHAILRATTASQHTHPQHLSPCANAFTHPRQATRPTRGTTGTATVQLTCAHCLGYNALPQQVGCRTSHRYDAMCSSYHVRAAPMTRKARSKCVQQAQAAAFLMTRVTSPFIVLINITLTHKSSRLRVRVHVHVHCRGHLLVACRAPFAA